MKPSATKVSIRNCSEFLGSMQMIRRLLAFAGIVKVTSRRFAASQDYGQRLLINWGVPVRAKRRVVIVILGIIIMDGISTEPLSASTSCRSGARPNRRRERLKRMAQEIADAMHAARGGTTPPRE